MHARLQVTWIARRAPFRPVASGCWAEVTHCSGGWNEKHAQWMYVARGAGLFVGVGRTISFGAHEDAVRHFLGRGCHAGYLSESRPTLSLAFDLQPTRHQPSLLTHSPSVQSPHLSPASACIPRASP